MPCTFWAALPVRGRKTGRLERMNRATGSNFLARSRAALAVIAGGSARDLSRLAGRGAGGMIGGRVALALDPQAIAALARTKRSVIVSGTNGKSTTTKMVRAALGTDGAVASNTRGDNMPPGVCTALMNDRTAPFAALEVDEMYVPAVAKQVHPDALVLLNLSRDQLDRVGEIGAVEMRLRQAVQENPQAHVIANCDDPLVVSAAWEAPKVTWVAAGSSWGADATTYPRGGGLVNRNGNDWWVEGGPSRPQPDWWLEGNVLHHQGGSYPLDLSLPGQVNLNNAAQAVAAAVALGIAPEVAARAVGTVTEVAGRYQVFDVAGRQVRLLLAKNPAGWKEALRMADPDSRQVVIATNGQVPDGEDLSWLWDVDFEVLDEPPALFASGDRAEDLAVRLVYGGFAPTTITDPYEAIQMCEPGKVEVLLNYTALRDLLPKLEEAAQ